MLDIEHSYLALSGSVTIDKQHHLLHADVSQ